MSRVRCAPFGRRPPPLPGGQQVAPVEMSARFAGTCATTGRGIRPGDTVLYDRTTRRTVLVTPAVHGVSDVIRTSGGTFYRNRNGRCEDAPCCGCCTI